MEISNRTLDSVQVIAMKGELDGKTAPAAQDHVLSLAVANNKMLLDMREVTYISSAGLRMLLLLYRQLSSSQGHLALVGLSERVRDTMETTGFLTHFATYSQLAEGLRALNCGDDTV